MFILIIAFLLLSPSWCFYDEPTNVVELTPSNFDKLVHDSKGIWIVEFYAPWCQHCRELRDLYDNVANVLKGVVNVGALDVDHFKDFGEKYNVRGFPTITIFGLKKKPRPYEGPRTLQGLVDAALKATKTKVHKRIDKLEGKKKKKKSKTIVGSDVIELTQENFDTLVVKSEEMWLVEFYAPWCGHCKNLKPEWEKAATALKGKIKVGAVDCSAHALIASEYAITGYPTIKVFPPGVKSGSTPEEYKGVRNADGIANFALDFLLMKHPSPEIKELIDQSTFDECTNKMLCVIGVLPHILDCQASCRENYLGTLRSMGKNFKSNDWGWMWAEAGSQPEVEEALSIGGFGYPALVALNKNKMKYIHMKGPFSLSGIKEFLRELAGGKVVSTYELEKGIPKVRMVAPWDRDYAETPKADEKGELVETQEESVCMEEVQLEKTTEVKDEL